MSCKISIDQLLNPLIYILNTATLDCTSKFRFNSFLVVAKMLFLVVKHMGKLPTDVNFATIPEISTMKFSTPISQNSDLFSWSLY